MTDELTYALSRLRADVGGSVAPPPGARLRQVAERRRRHRRIATGMVAAAVVGAILVSGGLIWRGGPSKTAPVPGVSPSPSPTRTASADARPSKQVPARQGPPQTPAIWAGVDWASATITLPAHEGCPSGTVTLRKEAFIMGFGMDRIVGPVSSWPKISILPEPVMYGDLNGDGKPEAVLYADCKQTVEDSGDGEGQLLAVRRDGATLRALGWSGPRGELITEWWVDGGRIVMDAKPWHTDWGYRLGAARAYQWTGQSFTEVDSGLPGIVSAIDFAPVAGLIGCPAASIRFGDRRQVTSDGVTWDLTQPSAPDQLQHLADLDGEGHRRVLIAVSCGGTAAVVLLDRLADGSFRAVDAIRPPEGTTVADWALTYGVLTVKTGSGQEIPYTWNGEYFQR
ncbi:hypothetical protein AB0J72_12285 [Dactylosporangium sp. NPDC049742]|uniref:hypothetical protein n=1 Tax=Dactylosporangium sp. NPDC049742 TaxID=3154737 RepID=UPI003420D917